MSDLVRLLEGDADAVERELLQSAALDAPAPEVRQRTLVALGVTSGVVASGAASWAGSGSATSGTSAAVPAAGGKAAGWLGMGGLAKWFGGGIAGGLLFAGAAGVVSESEPALEAAELAPVAETTWVAPAPPAVHAAASPSVEAVRPQPAPRAPERVAPVATQLSTPRPVKAQAPEPAPEPAAPTSVLDEVALLDAARTALQGGDLAKASSALQEHQQRYRGGALAPEATLLRIRMLLSTGRRGAATALAEGFLRRHPNSPHERRIRSLLEVP